MEALSNPFPEPKGDTGAIAQLERREEAEIMAMVAVAKRFQRDPRAACDKILMAFARKSLAEEAIYSYSRGGQEISDLTIRAMEAIATAWGNLDSSWGELSRGTGDDGVNYSLIEAKAWDLESTTRKRISFIVRHWRDTKRGGYPLKDERDIYELCANMAQRRVRACIGSLIPEDVKDLARNQAEATMATSAQVTPEGIKEMLDRFAPYGVTKEHIEAKIQRGIDAMAPAQMVQMRKIYRSLLDGMGKAGDFFDMPDEAPQGAARGLADLEKRGQASAPAASPAPAVDLAGTPLASGGDGGKANTGAPTPPTPDALIEKMKKAKSRDALDVHAGWITAAVYPDDAVRMRLGEVYDDCVKRFDK